MTEGSQFAARWTGRPRRRPRVGGGRFLPRLTATLLVLASCLASAEEPRRSGLREEVRLLPVIGGAEEPPPAEAVAQAIRIEAYNWGFEVRQTEVRGGETVRVVVHSREGAHGVIFPMWRVATPPVGPGETVMIDVMPRDSGQIAFACNVDCGVGHLAMLGFVEVVE